MTVSALRCTSCLAPLDPSRGARQRCAYCGITLVLDGSGEAPLERVHVLRLDALGPHKIDVIKVIRKYTGFLLKEAKELAEASRPILAESADVSRVDAYRAELALAGAETSVVIEVRPAPPAPAPPPKNGNVILKSHEGHIIMVIKVVREHTGLGLKEAKDLVEAAPCALTADWEPARAARFRADLRAAGAIVE